jgi:hypothetical protein
VLHTKYRGLKYRGLKYCDLLFCYELISIISTDEKDLNFNNIQTELCASSRQFSVLVVLILLFGCLLTVAQVSDIIEEPVRLLA